MRRVLGLAVVVALSACPPLGEKCSVDGDCGPTGACDPTYKVCVLIDAGGAGGGATGGGGGATGGGGGTTMTCETTGCDAGLTCRPGTAAACVPLTVKIVTPMAGAVVAGGTAVRVKATVKDWDGGAWGGASVPAIAAAGVMPPASLALSGPGEFTGDFTMPNMTGTFALGAGWPAANDSVNVATQVCTANCSAWQECVASQTGGTCADLGLTLTWMTPTEGQKMGAAAASALSLSLTATRADGGGFTGTIPFALDGGATGMLTKVGAAWTITVDAGIQDGPRALSAGWAGGPDAGRGFVVVATPPTVTLYPQDGVDTVDHDGAKRWKKSDIAKVQVESDRALASLTAADFVNAGVTVGSGCSRMCTAGATCACFDVDLAVQPYVQTTGEVFGTVDVALKPVVDVYGNTTSGVATKQFQVTRLKWVKQVAASATAAPALAISSGGLLVASVGNGLVALTPDGGTAWTVTGLNTTSPPMVGTQGVYVANSTSGPSASILQYDLLGQPRTPTQTCLGGVAYAGDLALAQPGASELPVAVRSDRRIAIGTAGCDSPSTTMTGLTGNKTVIVSGTDAFVAGNASASIWRFSTVNAGSALSGNASGQSLAPANLFDVGGVIGGGASAGPASGGAFAFVNAALLGNTTNSTPGTSAAGPAVVGLASSVFYGDNSAKLWRTTVSASAAFSGAQSTSSLSASALLSGTAPLVGDGSNAYVMGDDSVLRVVDSVTLALQWTWNPFFGQAAPTAVSQLNIDLNRDVAAPCASNAPGVLYLSASNGANTKVYALLVDSQGIPRTAAWPRYQHDPGNTGNAATDLTPWSCR